MGVKELLLLVARKLVVDIGRGVSLVPDANFIIPLKFARTPSPINQTNDCSDFPNCPNLAGTCLNIHVGEDIPELEINTVVAQQLTRGRPANGHNKQPHKVNGHTPRRENQPPKPVKPQEQVPLCKFAAGCTKPDCPFAHPTPSAGQDGLVLRGEMCPDGRNCQNREVYKNSRGD